MVLLFYPKVKVHVEMQFIIYYLELSLGIISSPCVSCSCLAINIPSSIGAWYIHFYTNWCNVLSPICLWRTCITLCIIQNQTLKSTSNPLRSMCIHTLINHTKSLIFQNLSDVIEYRWHGHCLIGIAFNSSSITI